MARKELACVDKFGRPLMGGVQVVQDCTIQRRSQATLQCRVNCKEITDLGVVEGTHRAIRLANSLNQLDCRRELLVQLINPFAESVHLSAGALVEKYHSTQETDVGPALETVADSQGNPPRTKQGAVLKHVADLYGEACDNCTSSAERQELAQLLMEYSGRIGVRGRGLGVGGGGHTSVNGGGLSCLTKSSICGMTTSYSGPRRHRPCIAVCRLGSNNGEGLSSRSLASAMGFQADFVLDGDLSRVL